MSKLLNQNNIPKKFLNRFFKYGLFSALTLLGLGFFVFALGMVYVWQLTQSLPSVTKLRDYNPAVPSYIFDREGKVLLRMGIENRDMVELKDTPKVIVDAVLSAEDGRFFEHQGIDFTGILRAMMMNIKAGRVVQGGSTITQQVAKSLLLTSEKTIERKIKDFLLAISIEQKFSKEEILFFYLNQVYLGRGLYGFKAATKGYFDKDISEINIAEAALLAGLLVAPTKYSPFNNPDHAKSRQSYVLSRMFEEGRITRVEYENALKTVLVLKHHQDNKLIAGYFTDWIRQRLIDVLGEEALLTGGYQIATTLDLELQTSAEEEVKKGSRDIDRRQGYKGALGHIEEPRMLTQEIFLRQNLLKKSSTFAKLFPTGELKDEFEISKEDLVVLQEQLAKSYENSKIQSIKNHTSIWIPQEFNNEILVSKIKSNELLDAMVLAVNDDWKIVYVTIGGLYGLIPLDGFQWAKKRGISDETVLGNLIERPSKILKSGDLIKISIASIEQKPLSSFFSNTLLASAKFKDNGELSDYIKNSKFVKCILEQVPEVQSSLLSLDVKTGEVLALVGGNDFIETKFNRVIQAKRQAGSAVKPIVYAAALELGYTPNSTLLDTPQALSSTDAILSWKPKNYDGEFKGLITLRKSLEESRNVSTVNLLQQIGIKKVLDFLKRFNKEIQIPPDLSVALGSFGISLLDLTSIYQIFPNGGMITPTIMVTSILDKSKKPQDLSLYSFLSSQKNDQTKVVASSPTTEQDKIAQNADLETLSDQEESLPNNSDQNQDTNSGKIAEKINQTELEFTESLKNNQVYDARLAFIMTNLLKGVVQNGTATNAKDLGENIAGKTGTTSEYVDAWFVGFSHNTVTGVWSGFDTNTTMGHGETGNQAALPIWKNFMAKVLVKRGNKSFLIPNGVIAKSVSRVSGLISSPKDPMAYTEFFVEGYMGDSRLNQSQSSSGDGTLIDRDNYFDQQ